MNKIRATNVWYWSPRNQDIVNVQVGLDEKYMLQVENKGSVLGELSVSFDANTRVYFNRSDITDKRPLISIGTGEHVATRRRTGGHDDEESGCSTHGHDD